MKNIRQLCLVWLLLFTAVLVHADDKNDIIIIKRGGSSTTSKAESSKEAGDVLMNAMGLLGVPYVFGGNSPSSGLDCSGLIKYVFQKSMNVNLPRTAAAMAKTGQSIDRDNLKPGDLVFFNTRGFANSHVGLYIGNNKFMHAPRTGKTVEVANMGTKYWTSKYNGARRIDANAQKAVRYANVETKPVKIANKPQKNTTKPEIKPKKEISKKTDTKKTNTKKAETQKKVNTKKDSAKKVNTTKKADTKKDGSKKADTAKKPDAKKTDNKKQPTKKKN